ncbi:amino acid/polyamine transporter I [Dendryphion nanum]|uniref:Amino acid/polyamine transporter I n=1 Tax=Dendryphion nanum TaxID=256645 RepID=A0A9P9DY45_9PLEO|nr:amino acid/polyamine transporter I [Dendryphion nanum]
MWAITVLPFLGNFWLRRILRYAEVVGAFCMVVFFFVSIITLLVMAEKSPASYVFSTLTHDTSGWTNPAIAWGIGLLTMAYPLTGFDAVLHMSDEVKKARIRVPRSMITSVVLNSIMQFTYMLTVLFTIGDVEKVTADPLPIIQVYYQATGSKAATNLFMSVFAIVIFVSLINILASDSRLLWAFARDNGLPFSKTFAQVHPKFKVPVNALVLVASCLCILALINVGSSAAFNAFISLPALALYISYFFPIFFLFLRRLSRARSSIQWGPFKLGFFGPFINLGAMCYLVFSIIWMPFPTMLPVDQLNFNYAGPIIGAVIVGALLDWCISGRKRFQVPVARLNPGSA